MFFSVILLFLIALDLSPRHDFGWPLEDLFVKNGNYTALGL